MDCPRHEHLDLWSKTRSRFSRLRRAPRSPKSTASCPPAPDPARAANLSDDEMRSLFRFLNRLPTTPETEWRKAAQETVAKYQSMLQARRCGCVSALRRTKDQRTRHRKSGFPGGTLRASIQTT